MRRFLTFLIFCLVTTLLSSCGPKGPAGTWSPLETGQPNTFLEELNFTTPEMGWAVGWDEKGPQETAGWEVLLTRDGGRTWGIWPKQVEQRIKLVHFVNDRVGWAINLDQDILTTNDGGETWTVQRKAEKVKIKYNYNNPGAPTELPDPLTRLRFISEKIGWAWGGGKKEAAFEQEGVFLRTENGGQQWQKVEYPFDDELKTLCFYDAYLGWASDRKAGLYKTIDGGKTWEKQRDDLRRPSINGIFFISDNKG
ncbi:MAG: hypothetical protein AB1489_03470, partial [Acidobacteriota bacterium]